ncbi:MAG: Phosphatidylglycerophosphatase A, partial [uncultured Ramlibacter sp.]
DPARRRLAEPAAAARGVAADAALHARASRASDRAGLRLRIEPDRARHGRHALGLGELPGAAVDAGARRAGLGGRRPDPAGLVGQHGHGAEHAGAGPRLHRGRRGHGVLAGAVGVDAGRLDRATRRLCHLPVLRCRQAGACGLGRQPVPWLRLARRGRHRVRRPGGGLLHAVRPGALDAAGM